MRGRQSPKVKVSRIKTVCVDSRDFLFVLVSLICYDLVSPVPCQEIGWEERLRNGPFRVEYGT